MAETLRPKIVGDKSSYRTPTVDSLPSKGADAQAFAEMGVRLGAIYADDPVFCRVYLKSGWTVEVSDSDATSFFVRDERENVRALIDYVHNETTRSAEIRPRTRYGYRVDPFMGSFLGVITDAGEVIYRSKTQDSWEEAEEVALVFLREHYSGWQHYDAYWP